MLSPMNNEQRYKVFFNKMRIVVEKYFCSLSKYAVSLGKQNCFLGFKDLLII